MTRRRRHIHKSKQQIPVILQNLTLLIFLFSFVNHPVAEVVEVATEEVIELNSGNFDVKVRDGNIWLVEFYAPWCGHCMRFASTYEAVAERLHATNDDMVDSERNIMVGKVDGAAERALASRFDVKGYPTFYVIDGWNVYEFEGSRGLEPLVEFASGSYKKMEPIPFLQSPFGPMGQLKALFMYVGAKVISMHESFVDMGYSSFLVVGAMCATCLMIGILLIVCIGLMTVPKPKDD